MPLPASLADSLELPVVGSPLFIVSGPELVIAHTNLYWGNHEAPGRTAAAVEANDVDFAAS